MPDLARFQAEFGAALAADAPTDPALARAMRIHRNTATKAALDALRANYPVLLELFGEAAFEACALAYVSVSPPRVPILAHYGADFPGFVATYPPASSASYAADVAALERMRTEALFAADAQALDGRGMTAVVEGAASVRLHPAVRFAAFGTPAFSIWSAHDGHGHSALEDLEWSAQDVLVSRPSSTVLVQVLPKGGIAFLTACATGASLAQAAAAAAEDGGEIAFLFSTLITAGAFA